MATICIILVFSTQISTGIYKNMLTYREFTTVSKILNSLILEIHILFFITFWVSPFRYETSFSKLENAKNTKWVADNHMNYNANNGLQIQMRRKGS